MLDLSNHNGHVDFSAVRKVGHQYVYLKLSEGATFTDPDFQGYYHHARQAGIKVGAYHFARPSQHSPQEEVQHFVRLLPKLERGKTLRPCLDIEDPDYSPGPKLARWVNEFLAATRNHVGYRAIVYGYASYLEECQFSHVPTGIWLAAYGRNDGVEHPFGIPQPWTNRRVLAHQYASTARVPGCEGVVDISRVLRPTWMAVNRLSKWGRH